ncbi:MAG: hypothetical protein FWD76_05905 [Firmicutes bacterium]|nr:hypothetical protein [Bacillota bacterium]
MKVQNIFRKNGKQSKSGKVIGLLSLSLCFLLCISALVVVLPVCGRDKTMSTSVEVEHSIIKENLVDDGEPSDVVAGLGEVHSELLQSLLDTLDGFVVADVTAIKELSDMGGYTYFDIEFGQKGYVICDNQFLYRIESSREGKSPYFDHTGNLLYLGPTQYFAMRFLKDGAYELESLGQGGTFEIDDLSDLRAESQRLEMIAKQEQEITRQINTQLAQLPQGRRALLRSGAQANRLRNQSVISGKDREYRYNDQSTGGNCGYVAGAIVLDYWQKAKGYSLGIPSWFGNIGTQTDGIAFVRKVQGALGGATWGPDLTGALTAWTLMHGYPLTWADFVFLPGAGRMWDLIGQDRPVVLGGSLPGQGFFSGNDNHAVTIHGVRRWQNTFLGITVAYSDYVYECNYGYSASGNNLDIKASFFDSPKGYAVWL